MLVDYSNVQDGYKRAQKKKQDSEKAVTQTKPNQIKKNTKEI